MKSRLFVPSVQKVKMKIMLGDVVSTLPRPVDVLEKTQGHKYVKRWKDKRGEWAYEYTKPKGHPVKGSLIDWQHYVDSPTDSPLIRHKNIGHTLETDRGTYKIERQYDDIPKNTKPSGRVLYHNGTEVARSKVPSELVSAAQMHYDSLRPQDVGETALSIATLSPDDPEYREKVIRTQEFKQWFGDWERKAGSKVVDAAGKPQEQYHLTKVPDAEGIPRVVYHGTAKGGFTEFDPTKCSPGLYGRGFYFTEDKAVAESYEKKESSFQSARFTFTRTQLEQVAEFVNGWKDELQRRYGLDYVDVRVDDRGLYTVADDGVEWRPSIFALGRQLTGEDAYPDELMELFGFRRRELDGPVQEFTDRIGWIPETDDNKQVYEVFLNIRNPFDVDHSTVHVSLADDPQELIKKSIYELEGSIQYSQGQFDESKGYLDEALAWKARADAKGANTRSNKYKENEEVIEFQTEQTRKLSERLAVGRYDLEKIRVGEMTYSFMEKYRFKESAMRGPDKDVINGFLQSNGYDGLTHIGGDLLGKGKHHRVWIAFDPKQIKSTKSVGFDPTVADITKSVRLCVRGQSAGELLKARPTKYIRRWRGKDGQWEYAYATPDGSGKNGTVGDPKRGATIKKDIGKIISGSVGGVRQVRAKVGGEIGPNGEYYKGGAFIATANLPKKVKQDIHKKGSGKVEVEPYKWEVPQPGQMSIFTKMESDLIDRHTGIVNEQYKAYMKFTDEDVLKFKSLRDMYNRGERWISVNDYPELGNIQDVARLLIAELPIPGVLLDKVYQSFPEMKGYIEKWGVQNVPPVVSVKSTGLQYDAPSPAARLADAHYRWLSAQEVSHAKSHAFAITATEAEVRDLTNKIPTITHPTQKRMSMRTLVDAQKELERLRTVGPQSARLPDKFSMSHLIGYIRTAWPEFVGGTSDDTIRKKFTPLVDLVDQDMPQGSFNVPSGSALAKQTYGGANKKVGYTIYNRELVDQFIMDAMERGDTVGTLTKSLSYPEGSIRRHKGKAVQKTKDGWSPVESESFGEGRVLKATIEMYNALHDVKDESTYLDDLHGEDKKVFDRLTKLGLVKWDHVGSDEYVAVLTEKGQSEFRKMKAVEQKYARMVDTDE
jgi:hypothetical protein